MPSLTKKNRGRCTNSHNSTIKILDRPRSSPTNTMWSLMPANQGYQRMREEIEEGNLLKTQKTQLKNRLREKMENVKNVKNKIKIKYNSDEEDDEEVADINETWKTCEGDYTQPLRKSPTTKDNLNGLVGGKPSKKKTRKQRKHKKPIPYKKKSIKYK
jgi:hypothetical protein